jgi:starch-binding outer membrane protein, SusD/RagB family
MKKIHSILLAVLLIASGLSCKKDFLDEEPLDFLSSANAFKTSADFEASTNNLYRLLRDVLFTRDETIPFDYIYRTDAGLFVPSAVPPNLTSELAPHSDLPRIHWQSWYKIISESNTIISRIPASQLSAGDKELFEARARFFRAYAYSRLAYLYGGVPLVLEEVVEPKTDYVRATRKEVYAQCIADLVFAAGKLQAINNVKDGEVSNLAAQHLLAELYIADGQFDQAVTAASSVIGDPNMTLMTNRFGKKKDVNPGDVYWDLFRRGNQNRGAGNKETILVIQIENDTKGGAGSTTQTGWPFNSVYNLERVHSPLIRDVQLPDISGTKPMAQWPASDYTSGGRGVGFLAPSHYFVHSAFQAQGDAAASVPDSVADIRNANHNFVRKFKVTRPGNSLYPVGTEIDFHNIPAGTKGFGGKPLLSGDVANRAMYPYQTKCTEPGDHPANLYAGSTSYPPLLKSTAAPTFRDEYLFRLAETYLLRAEAYLGQGNTALAAADINVVRTRANASSVAAGSVNIDFILDERMREFGIEEKRMFTLMRLGKWYDRIVKCNPFYAQSADPKYNLWPIPYSEIERNNGAKLEQNPGYN